MPPITVATEVNRPAPARCITVRRIGFADRPSSSELVHCDPPRSWRVRGVDGPIRAKVDVTVEPLADDRSRLTIAVGFDGLVRREAGNEMPANVATLKRRLETST
jgi:hypothetical protein